MHRGCSLLAWRKPLGAKPGFFPWWWVLIDLGKMAVGCLGPERQQKGGMKPSDQARWLLHPRRDQPYEIGMDLLHPPHCPLACRAPQNMRTAPKVPPRKGRTHTRTPSHTIPELDVTSGSGTARHMGTQSAEAGWVQHHIAQGRGPGTFLGHVGADGPRKGLC